MCYTKGEARVLTPRVCFETLGVLSYLVVLAGWGIMYMIVRAGRNLPSTVDRRALYFPHRFPPDLEQNFLIDAGGDRFRRHFVL